MSRLSKVLERVDAEGAARILANILPKAPTNNHDICNVLQILYGLWANLMCYPKGVHSSLALSFMSKFKEPMEHANHVNISAAVNGVVKLVAISNGSRITHYHTLRSFTLFTCVRGFNVTGQLSEDFQGLINTSGYACIPSDLDDLCVVRKRLNDYLEAGNTLMSFNEVTDLMSTAAVSYNTLYIPCRTFYNLNSAADYYKCIGLTVDTSNLSVLYHCDECCDVKL